MKVTVQYFAILREQSGVSEELIETATQTYAQLFKELSNRHRFTLTDSAIKVAANGEFRKMNDAISNGETVVFLPPVAGG